MSLTRFLMIALMGIILMLLIGGLMKNKLIIKLFSIMLIILIIFILFLVFILIPSM